MPDSKGVKISNAGFRTLIGMEPTKNTLAKDRPADISNLQRYTAPELRNLLNKAYIQPEIRRADFTAAGIISYLKPTHMDLAYKKANFQKMNALAPEIEQSKILVSSSILSPNDLQEGVFNFNFDKIPALASDPALAEEIRKVYDQHFNNTLQLGIRSYDWIGDMQYVKGAIPLLILPTATLEALKHRTTKDIVKDRLDNLKFIGLASYDNFRETYCTTDDDYLYSEMEYTWHNLFNELDSHKETTNYQLLVSMESIGITDEFLSKSKDRSDVSSGIDLQAGMESILVNIKKLIEDGDVIRISENPEILKFNTIKKLKDKHEVYKKLLHKYESKKNYPYEDFVTLEPNPQGYTHTGHPTIIELPVESVIPIYVPGAPDQHLGYFILIDQNGQPLTGEASGADRQNMGGGQCKPGDVSGAYDAIFGSNCKSSFFGGNSANMITAAGQVFQFLLDKYIGSRLKGIYGRDDLELSRFNAIATVMFHRLLERKHTTLVYVPPQLLHYLAFDYRKDGTGKTKLDEIQYILSLRTTLMIAQVMAMANDAVPHKTINVGFDDKNANVEYLLEGISNIFIEKNKLTGSIDPSEIMRDIYSNALTIVPKNIPGLQTFDVDVSENSSNTTRPDDQLLEQITNLLVSHLDVPPSALNQLSEPEFSRSLVTYNLFFAKKITRYQRIYCGLMTEFAKDYAYFDPKFRHAILKKLVAAGKRRVRENLEPKAKKIQKANQGDYERSYNGLIYEIINNVEFELSKPDIVVDKTQFEEIRNHLDNVQQMADLLYPQELVSSDDMEAQNALPIIKAKWKRDQILKFIDNVGAFRMVDMQEIDDIDTDDVLNFTQVLQNLSARIKKQRENISAPSDQGGFGESGYGDEVMGANADTDADMDFGGGDEDMFGGGGEEEMFGGEGGEESSTGENMNITSAREKAEGEESDMFGAELYINLNKKN